MVLLYVGGPKHYFDSGRSIVGLLKTFAVEILSKDVGSGSLISSRNNTCERDRSGGSIVNVRC